MAVARSGLVIVLDQASQVEYSEGKHTADSTGTITKDGKTLLVRAMKHLEGMLSGAKRGSHAQIFANTTQPIAAAGLVTFSSIADADTVTLGSTTLTCKNSGAANNEFNVGASDTAAATNFAAAILASTTAACSSVFEASNWAGSVALSSVAAGTKIYIAGHEFTAVTGTATALPTYANAIAPGDFTIAGTNTQDGDSLTTAINAHPVLGHQVFAKNSSGTVTIYQRRGTAALGKITATATTVTCTQFTAGTTTCISPLVEGLLGNQLIALAISAHGSVVQWAGGAGLDVTPKHVLVQGAVS